MKTGTKVSYRYHKHPILGGALVEGTGTIIGRTIVGTQDAYIIKPDSGDVVHVRVQGVCPI